MSASVLASVMGGEPTPKVMLIVNTLLVVIATAILVRGVVWVRNGGQNAFPTAAAPERTGGQLNLSQSSFGDIGETRRDAGRAFCAGSVYLQAGARVTALPLRPVGKLPGGVDKDSIATQIDCLAAMISEGLEGLEMSPPLLKRLLPMLTVNPALEALSAAGEMPMLMQHRFIIKAAVKPGGGATLQVLTMGFVGEPHSGGRPNERSAPFVLIVASADLLAGPDGDPTEYKLAYSIRQATYRQIDSELPAALMFTPTVG
jgi:hypothetical protein